MGKNKSSKPTTNLNMIDNEDYMNDIIDDIYNENTHNPPALPFVSVCTPTFNRRPFIPAMLKCFDYQTYPKDRMEWIIIDDGTDKIEDLVKDHPNIKYFKYDTKMTLGKKRNLLHEKSKGDILVYMDDDDYYPPERVSHAVYKLQSNEEALCAGASEIYIYFKHINQMYQFGPYGPNHATAGTFAFKRQLLEDNRYDDTACLAEEKAFLKNYTVPFVQLEPRKTILVFSHEHNTFDKRKLLDNPHPQYVKQSDKSIDYFINEPELKEFYIGVDSLLENYSPGRPIMKPDVLEQMIKIEETRRKHAENMSRSGASGQIMIHQDGKDPISLNNNQIVELMKQQQSQLQQQYNQIQLLKGSYEQISRENMELKQIVSTKTDSVTTLQKLNTMLLSRLADKGAN